MEDLSGGAAAGYLAVSQDWIARKPPSVSHQVMAAVPCAYLTAWQALVQKAGLKKGQKILVYGASGGVGTAAVQIARYLGAGITAVSSKRNTAYCLQQGAHQALTYDEGDFSRDVVQDYDVFFQVHVLSGSLYPVAKKVLKPAGVFVTLDPGPVSQIRSLASYIWPGPSFRNLLVKSGKENLSQLARLAGEGVLRPFPQQILPLDDIRQAHEQLESGHTTGKVVLVIPDSLDGAEKGEVSEENTSRG